MELGALAGGLGCSPFDNEAYPPLSISRFVCIVFGVWFPLVGRKVPRVDPVLYPYAI